MTTSDYLEPDIWFAQLPGVVLAAGALITDPAGRALLVKPNYRDHWTVPGGICEHGEPPHAGCAREVAEEIGLTWCPGRCWRSTGRSRSAATQRPIMHFLFDGGTLDGGSGIVLQREELDDFRFTDPADLAGYLPPHIEARVRARASRAGGRARPSTSRPRRPEPATGGPGRMGSGRSPGSGAVPWAAVSGISSPVPVMVRHRRAPSTSARWGWITSSASATLTGRPASADKVVTVASRIPQGTIRSIPGQVAVTVQREAVHGHAPGNADADRADLPVRPGPPGRGTHTPLRPSTRVASTPNSAQARISASSMART